MRIGMGYDVHRLEEGRKLILGGVEIPYEKGLLEQRGRPAGVCRVAGGAGSYCNQRKTGSSRWGTPCCTYRYRMWIFQGASGRAHLVFLCFVL